MCRWRPLDTAPELPVWAEPGGWGWKIPLPGITALAFSSSGGICGSEPDPGTIFPCFPPWLGLFGWLLGAQR